jgi:uncharacterized phage protein (TIGR01671 family)
MREILFRGKRKDNGEWVEGGIYHNSEDEIVFIIKDTGLGYHEFIEVIPETVGQFTGLYDKCDKNGTKIFEGDIITQNWYDYTEPSDDSIGEVVFCKYDCSFSVLDVEKYGIVPLGKCHAYHWEAEVIGNIHDNPELLEGEAE